VPILDGLDITAKTAGNVVIEQVVRRARGRIERGETIAAPLRSSGAFPVMVVQMIGAGESTGALDTMLAKIADVYEGEVDVAVAAMLSVLEPVLIVALGVLVGGIVISMYLPLFQLVEQLS
jgi:type IV pilus assembly protein PilC